MRATAYGSTVTANNYQNKAMAISIAILTWAFTTLLWSILTPPHRTFAARNVIFQPLWILRLWLEDLTWLQDLALFETLHTIYSYSNGAWKLPSKTSLRQIDLSDRTLQMYFQIFTLLCACAISAGAIVFRGKQIKSADDDRPEALREQTIDEQVLPPLLLPSRTTHSRLFPEKHSFSYSYLFVGIPVGVQGRISTVLSVDSAQKGWFSINSADHMGKDDGRRSLAAKLKQYLLTQGVVDRDWAFAYLVTAPRFAGYNFNPVSFWYLYDSDTKLCYMVLEVNNTFDERRMYLLRGDKSSSESAVTKNGNARSLVFSEVWEKDFHVSPFNSRKGTYSLRAVDPLAHYEETGNVQIDNTIVLRSSKEHSKIVARVFSDGAPSDPAEIGTLELANFIASWWWVGFATFPRIVKEAAKLSFQRRLHVWYKPEVSETSLGRSYMDDERLLEAFFRAFLAKTVAESTNPLRVVYEPPHSEEPEIVMYSPGFTYEEDLQRTLTLKVLSPAFYSRFVHYAHAKEALDRECLATDEKNRTLSIGRPELLSVLLDALKDQRKNAGSQSASLFEQVRWSCLRRLRCPPAAASYSTPINAANEKDYHMTDIRSFAASELDCFVQKYCEDADIYRRLATKLFLAERFALGLPALLVAIDFLIRGALLVTSMWYSENCHPVDILRPREYFTADLWTLGTTVFLANAVHLWSFAKG